VLGASLYGIVGGWQLSAINTAQGGTPYNLTYTPNSANVVSPQISATYSGANEYRPDRVADQDYVLCHSGHSCLKDRLANGAIQYVNYAAFALRELGIIANQPFRMRVHVGILNADMRDWRVPHVKKQLSTFAKLVPHLVKGLARGCVYSQRAPLLQRRVHGG
jgi:hypothetical protein